MKPLFDFVRYQFKKPKNGLAKLIIAHGLAFGGLLGIKVATVLIGKQPYYALIRDYLLLPSNWYHFLARPWTLFTHFFVQEHLFSTAFNMFTLYTLGSLITRFLGSQRMVALYLLGNLAGGAAFLLLYNLAPYFKHTYLYLGSSATGMCALLAGAATFAPNFPIYLFVFGPIRLKYVVLAFVLYKVFELASSQTGTHVAPIMGALAGYLYVQASYRLYGRSLFSRIRRPFKKSTAPKSSNPSSSFSQPGNTTQAGSTQEIDEILDKISKHGYNTLTQEEKYKLFNAGK